MKYFSLLLLLVLTVTAPMAQAADQGLKTQFQKANQAYMQGHYQQAVALYLDIAEKKGVSANLLYNLANSYAALGRPGKAIVNYQRALRLDPGDPDIRANLTQVQKDEGLYQDDKPLLQRLIQLLSPDQWLVLALTGLVLLSALYLVSALGRFLPFAIIRSGLWGALLLLLISLPAAVYGYHMAKYAVVVGSDVHLLLSPFKEAENVGNIKAGKLVKPGKTHTDFILVTDDSGHGGWLPRQQIELITDLPAS